MHPEEKAKIRSIYAELQGYLHEAPEPGSITRNDFFWNQFNKAIDELSELGNKGYEKFRINPKTGQFGSYIDLSSYRGSLGGLIAKLHADYFLEESAPFGTLPSTIITTTQNQNQSVKIEIAVEMTELITNKIKQYEEGSAERSFLERIRQGVKEGKGLIELVNLILKTGAEFGLTISTMAQLLSR